MYWPCGYIHRSMQHMTIRLGNGLLTRRMTRPSLRMLGKQDQNRDCSLRQSIKESSQGTDHCMLPVHKSTCITLNAPHKDMDTSLTGEMQTHQFRQRQVPMPVGLPRCSSSQLIPETTWAHAKTKITAKPEPNSFLLN